LSANLAASQGGPRIPDCIHARLVCTHTHISSPVMTTGWGSITRLLILGITFHSVYIATVFDCYFTSPVVHGMRQYKLPQAQAKRLVLIIGARTQPPPLWKQTILAFRRDADVPPHICQVMVYAPTLPLLQMLHRSCRARRSVSRHI
jgi:hypothetical protein